MLYAIRLILTGIVIGMANVIPGVSGGTLAVVFNIYDKFVNAITLNLKKLKANWKFIVPLLAGMACGVLLFSKLITVLYTNFPVQTDFCFTGLILGSMPMLFKCMLPKEDEPKFDTKKKTAIILCVVFGLIFLLFFSWLNIRLSGETEVINPIMPDFTWPLAFKIFIAGILGAITMVIPGISGSLIMLIMGVYTIVITSIPNLFHADTFWHALILLLPNGIGVIIGLLTGAKLVSYLLKKAPQLTYAVIFGLLIGSAMELCPMLKLFPTTNPWPLCYFDAACFEGMKFWGIFACVLSLLGGAALAYFTSKFAPEEKPAEEETETPEETK